MNFLKKICSSKKRVKTYFHSEYYQSDLIIRDKFIFYIGSINIITFYGPNANKEAELIIEIEKVFNKKVIKRKNN